MIWSLYLKNNFSVLVVTQATRYLWQITGRPAREDCIVTCKTLAGATAIQCKNSFYFYDSIRPQWNEKLNGEQSFYWITFSTSKKLKCSPFSKKRIFYTSGFCIRACWNKKPESYKNAYRNVPEGGWQYYCNIIH